MDVGKRLDAEFRFLPGLEATYNNEIRAFVLQKYMTKRKNRAYARNRAKSQNDKDETQMDVAAIGRSSRGSTESGAYRAGRDPDVCGPLVSTRLGTGRADPFQTYARITNSVENAMIDEYLMNVYTWFGLKRSKSFCPSRDLMFPHNIRDEVTILAMIAYGASTHERRRGAPRKDSTKYRALAIRALNQRLQQEHACPGDALLAGVCGLICITTETRSKDATMDEVAEMFVHAQGLRAMIATRGGWTFVRCCDNWLSFLVLWVDILLGGAVSAGSTILSQHIHSAPSQFHSHARIICEANDPEIYYPEEFIGAYADFYRAALGRRNRPPKSPSQTHPFNRSPSDLFQPATPSHRLLSSTESVQLHRFAPLVYINIMLWNYCNCPCETLDSLHDTYARNIAASDVDLAGSIEVLVWGLMTNVDTKKLMHLNWIELMTRMQYVEARLRTGTQEMLANTLLEFILQGSGVEDVDAPAKWWTPEQFAVLVREELMDAVWV